MTERAIEWIEAGGVMAVSLGLFWAMLHWLHAFGIV